MISGIQIVFKVWVFILLAALVTVIAAGALVDVVDDLKRAFRRRRRP